MFDDEADALVFAVLVRKIRIDILYFLTQTEKILVALQRRNIVGSNVTKFNIVINGTGKKTAERLMKRHLRPSDVTSRRQPRNRKDTSLKHRLDTLTM